MRLRGVVALAFAVSVISACSGGGGGGGSSPQTQVSLAGTVAGNIAMANYSMTFLAPFGPPNPTSARSATSSSGPDGRYSITASLGDFRPIIITAAPPDGGSQPQGEPQYPSLHSLAYRSGTANVTSLTSLLVARLLNRKPDPGFDFRTLLDLQNRPEADLTAARAQVVSYLLSRPNKNDGNATSSVDVAAVTDFLFTPLNLASGDPHSDALRRVHESMMDSETIRGTMEHMLFGNDAPADLRSMLEFDFLADCAVQFPGGTEAVPNGPARIILDRRAITIGSVDFAFQTGDQVTVEAPQANQPSWMFTFNASHSQIEIRMFLGRLNDLVISVPAGSSRCVVRGEIPLSGKHPSQIALIRLLGQSLSGIPRFDCAGPVTYSGFVAAPAPNLLAIETSSALRINGTSGLGAPALHLPSLNLHLEAPITVASGQVEPIRLTFFRADRGFRDGFDGLAIGLDAGGKITGLSLQRRNGASDQSQHCGTL